MPAPTPKSYRLAFLGLSAAVHLGLIAAFGFAPAQGDSAPNWERPCLGTTANHAAQCCASQKCQAQSRDSLRDQDLALRLIQQNPQGHETLEPPEEAKYLGEKNITVSRDTKRTPRLVAMRPKEPKPRVPKPEAAQSQTSTLPTAQSPAPAQNALAQSQESKKNDESKENSTDSPKFNLAMPTADWGTIIEQSASAPIDSLEEVPDVGQGLVNQRQTKYASLWNRIRSQVASQWAPDEVYLPRDPNFTRFARVDRLSVLSVTINGYGQIIELKLKEGSGLDFLDEEAIRAMYAAGPFPNPPEGLRNLEGELQFEFGFLLEWITGARRLFYLRQ